MTKTIVDTAYYVVDRKLKGLATDTELEELRDLLKALSKERAQLYCYVGTKYINVANRFGEPATMSYAIVAENQKEALQMLEAYVTKYHLGMRNWHKIDWKTDNCIPVRTDVSVEKGVRFVSVVFDME